MILVLMKRLNLPCLLYFIIRLKQQVDVNRIEYLCIYNKIYTYVLSLNRFGSFCIFFPFTNKTKIIFILFFSDFKKQKLQKKIQQKTTEHQSSTNTRKSKVKV